MRCGPTSMPQRPAARSVCRPSSHGTIRERSVPTVSYIRPGSRGPMAAQRRVAFHEHVAWSRVTDGARRAALERFRGPRRWPSWMLDAARTREQAVTPEHLDALAVVVLPDQDGNEVRLRELWRDLPAVLVWLRQFGCPFCRAYFV